MGLEYSVVAYLGRFQEEGHIQHQEGRQSMTLHEGEVDQRGSLQPEPCGKYNQQVQ